MRRNRVCWIAALALVFCPVATGVRAQHMFWTGGEEIRAAGLDGTHMHSPVTSGIIESLGIAVSPAVGKVYWTDSTAGKIQCAAQSGGVSQDLVTGFMDPWGIAIDPAGRKMYWTDSATGKIQRAELDGTAVEDTVTGLSFPARIALDTDAGKVYWTDSYSNKVQRADLDGSNVEDLVTGLGEPTGMALDLAAKKIYWTDNFFHKIQRSDLDGGNVEDVLTGLGGILDIDLDLIAGKMYWTDYAVGDVLRANTDGSGIETLITGLPGSSPFGIALDLSRHNLMCTSADYSGTTVYHNDFEDTLDPLTEWSDDAREVTPVAEREFLGRHSNGTLTFTLNALPDHGVITMSFDLFIIGSWEGNLSSSGPDVWGVTVDGGNTLLQTTFSHEGGSTQAYPGTFPEARYARREGANETNTLGYDRDSVYMLKYTFLHSGETLVVDFVGLGLEGVADESWGLDNVWVWAAPAGSESFYFNNFEDSGNSLEEWSDPATDSTPVGGRTFLGPFSDSSVILTLNGLPPHDTATVECDLFVIDSWDGNGPTSGPDIWDLRVVDGPALWWTTFADSPGTFQAYPGAYPNGAYAGQTGATEVGALGYTADSVYHIVSTFEHSSDALALSFAGVGLEGLADESWGLDNVAVTLTECPEHDIPTITEWGMLVMTILLVVVGTRLFAGRLPADSE